MALHAAKVGHAAARVKQIRSPAAQIAGVAGGAWSGRQYGALQVKELRRPAERGRADNSVRWSRRRDLTLAFLLGFETPEVVA